MPPFARRFHPPVLRLPSAAWALVSLLAVGSGLAGSAPAQTRLAQVTIEQALSNEVQVRGRVAEIFGDRLLVEDATGRILVELAETTDKPSAVAVGQILLIEGRLRGRTIEARRVAPVAEGAAPEPPAAEGPAGAARVDRLLDALARPADAATIRSTLEAIGLSPAGAPVRRNKHTEIPARDARGQAWSASLDRFGRLEEIELEDYDDDDVPPQPRFDPAELARIVEREGYRTRAAAERRPEHFEVIALNRQGDLVEVHVDFAGVIYKIVWIR
ncbi:hypothetical protein BN1110_02434 [bacterium YEK0313]|nr:hypothetical protein BN1110_02434 [bacterium YEK0313]